MIQVRTNNKGRNNKIDISFELFDRMLHEGRLKYFRGWIIV